ncbi:hypothetical protein CBR_g52213 [Chara braunii]|uniref:Oberon-like PHD finger domain-containing protein n=1 Tax=Chara braunii TaxID=69332 RepID=A0A388M9S6_CHABU|nr:hypothetical protein CBR_g52213 [Chara braunii]|eukprot:GBG91327.1 hypothetical protein CBR_g52213 [Chara braunii]
MGVPMFAWQRLTIEDVVQRPIDEIAEKLGAQSPSEEQDLKLELRDMLLMGSEAGRMRLGDLQLMLLKNHRDTDEEKLSRSCRTQLEILVAVRTGVAAYVHPQFWIATHFLSEIFRQVRCCNLTCMTAIPADRCNCDPCRNPGFCNRCMCVMCGRFGLDHDTCHWISCGICYHFCHTECAVAKGALSYSVVKERELLYTCVSCKQTSGFDCPSIEILDGEDEFIEEVLDEEDEDMIDEDDVVLDSSSSDDGDEDVVTAKID